MSGHAGSRTPAEGGVAHLWRAVVHGHPPDGPDLGDRWRALPRMVGDTLAGRYAALGRARLGLPGLALVYLVSPVDLVPEAVVPLVGLADDGVSRSGWPARSLAETDRFLAWEHGRVAARPADPLRGDRGG